MPSQLNRYRLAFVGPMVVRQANSAPSQGEWLADNFAAEGHPVICVSSQSNRVLRMLDILQALLRHSRNIDIQCVQVYSGASFLVADVASLLGRMLGHKLILALHGGNLLDFMARHPNWTRRVLWRAHKLVAPSPFLAEGFKKHGFEVNVIPNILDFPTYPYRHRTQLSPKLFWMRSFHAIYNPRLAVRVLARLRETVPEATLVMAGSNLGSFDEIMTYADELHQSKAITFPGFLDQAAKFAHGDAADVFINTNQIDNMPVSVVEACAMGLPVVTTNVGGMPYLLEHEKTGLLVPADDEEAMAAAIVRLLNDPELSGRLSANGHALAEKLSWPRVLPEWQAMFEMVMKDLL